MTDDRIRCQICLTGVNSVILEKKKETRIGTMQLSGQLLRVERWTPIKWRPLKSFQFGPRDGTVIALRWSGSVADEFRASLREEKRPVAALTHTQWPQRAETSVWHPCLSRRDSPLAPHPYKKGSALVFFAIDLWTANHSRPITRENRKQSQTDGSER